MYSVNDVVSDRLKVTPLKDGEIAKYRLYKADQIDVTRTEASSGKKLNHQQVYSFVGKKKIFDPFTKRKVEIMNIESFKTQQLPDGQLKSIPVVGRLLFPRTGELILTSRDQEQYAFMERMNENGSNEFRDDTLGKPTFYRVDIKKQTMMELEKDYIMVDALVHVRDAGETEVQTIYKGLDAETKKTLNADNYEQLKKGLLKLSQENPILVLKASTNKVAKVKVQCMEASKWKIISFAEGGNGEERRWVFIGGDKPTEICTLEPGVHKIDGLVKFFIENKEGKNWYEQIISKLKDVLEFKGKK